MYGQVPLARAGVFGGCFIYVGGAGGLDKVKQEVKPFKCQGMGFLLRVMLREPGLGRQVESGEVAKSYGSHARGLLDWSSLEPSSVTLGP